MHRDCIGVNTSQARGSLWGLLCEVFQLAKMLRSWRLSVSKRETFRKNNPTRVFRSPFTLKTDKIPFRESTWRPFHTSLLLPKIEEKSVVSAVTGVPTEILSKRRAYISKPPPTAAQSGPGRDLWVLQFDRTEQTVPSALMGWSGGEDPFSSLTKLHFETKEEALRYAEENGFDVELREPEEKDRLKIAPKSYSDNFKYRPPKKKPF